jgi:hypothetical protein
MPDREFEFRGQGNGFARLASPHSLTELVGTVSPPAVAGPEGYCTSMPAVAATIELTGKTLIADSLHQAGVAAEKVDELLASGASLVRLEAQASDTGDSLRPSARTEQLLGDSDRPRGMLTAPGDRSDPRFNACLGAGMTLLGRELGRFIARNQGSFNVLHLDRHRRVHEVSARLSEDAAEAAGSVYRDLPHVTRLTATFTAFAAGQRSRPQFTNEVRFTARAHSALAVDTYLCADVLDGGSQGTQAGVETTSNYVLSLPSQGSPYIEMRKEVLGPVAHAAEVALALTIANGRSDLLQLLGPEIPKTTGQS